MTALTALIVEDWKEFRRFLRVTLSENGQCKVIAEVSDGLHAVQQVQDFLALPGLLTAIERQLGIFRQPSPVSFSFCWHFA